MLLSSSDLIYSSSLISKAFFWANIDNTNTSNKQFKVFLYPNRISIGSVEPQNSLMNPGNETSTFTEEKTILISDLKEIQILPNSDIFTRTYIIFNNNEIKKINWFTSELTDFLSKLNPLLPKKVKITNTTIQQEKIKNKIKFGFSILGLLLVISVITYFYFKLFI